MKPSFHNNWAFLKKVDTLPYGAAWSCKNITVQGDREDGNGNKMCKNFELWIHDPVECIKDLIENPLFKNHIVYAPSRAYMDGGGLQRMIDDM